MGRKVKIHVSKDGEWVPIGEAYIDTPTLDIIRRYAEADYALLGLIRETVEEVENKNDQS